MFKGIRNHWLPSVLLRFFLFLAGLMMVLVLASPFLDDGRSNPVHAHRWIVVLARDLAVRRTVVACSVGLAATAWIFFQPRPEAHLPKLEIPIKHQEYPGGNSDSE